MQTRTDNGHEIPPTHAELAAELAKIDPTFDPSGKSRDYLQARLDHARDQLGTADAAAAKTRHDAAEAWKPADRRAAAASVIDPDALQRRAYAHNAKAWKTNA